MHTRCRVQLQQWQSHEIRTQLRRTFDCVVTACSQRNGSKATKQRPMQLAPTAEHCQTQSLTVRWPLQKRAQLYGSILSLLHCAQQRDTLAHHGGDDVI